MNTAKVHEFMQQVERLRSVARWSGTAALSRSNVLEHTGRTMFWARILADTIGQIRPDLPLDSFRARLYEYMLFHDLGERWTNDVNHHIKRKYAGLKEILDVVESTEVTAAYPFDSVMKEVSEDVKVTGKCADIIDFCFEAAREIGMGNSEREYRYAWTRGANILQVMLEKVPKDAALSESAEIQYYAISSTMKIVMEFIPDCIHLDPIEFKQIIQIVESE